ncbi:hypothetical protein [Melittangium boletus]|uniref:Uncharacterized protein n=1 Tax=Melittangium boletus DSM 14713 TaxID=1294270 RepID=A0A250ISA2_9BACT|nr:hypothetical protein [Melittangium boletus]ATB34031.1 hypothetical protein MEBOL_007532 [Melittangium boletus DSM 14713]
MGLGRNLSGRDPQRPEKGDSRNMERPVNRKGIDFLRNRGEAEESRDLASSEQEERSLEDTPVDQSRSGH